MNESTSNHLNDWNLDDSSETHQFDETSCVVDEKFVPKVGMIFKTLEEAAKFYKHYSKLAGFSTKIRNTTRDGDKIKNQLITNPSAGLNCPARIYVHIIKNVVILNHSHPCCPDQAEMLKQHRELSMFVRRTIETHAEAGIRPSKTYQSFVAVAGSHRELGFIEKYVRSYITREMHLTETETISSQSMVSEATACTVFGSPDLIVSVWYAELYEDRHIWIPVYLDHHFWAGMRSTQRNESMHSFFNKFITRNSSLRQFVKQYDNCLTKREFDAADFHTVIPCATKSAIEEQFQCVYTHEKFREVQAQFRGKLNCITRSMHSTLGFTTYEVIKQVSNSTFNKFVVTYDAVSQDVKCHCLLFESRGILCRHSLSVLSFERVDNVTPKYILERWSKNIKRRHTHIKSSQDEPLLEPRIKRFDELVFRSHNICEFVSESEELTKILHRSFDKVMAEMEEYQRRRKGKSLLTHEEATLSNVNDLQSPLRVKTRGRPKNRLGSKLKKKDLKCYEEKEKDSSKRDSGSSIQSSSTLYNTPDMKLSKRGLYKF
ncbi:hypothetical protein Ahy_B02g058904 [Arachis hypogaea]|uniref:Protein FAR1-RELATED SEQUENCE n=1 Tax=Arachis hypogaea TaxID=3818 RepID=A0A445AFM3_ARAHY|nr:hypothetical protein Ahy_B02g058904 [Arachis hypogaea]